MPRDYYEILGVSRSCDHGSLKKSHRKLARQYHPDINKDPDAQQRFNEIQEAYDVLSDDKKRQLYDQFGHAGVGAAAPPPPGGPFGNDGGGGFNFRVDGGPGGPGGAADIFEQFFGGSGRRGGGPRRPQAGRDIEQQIDIPFDFAVQGGALKVKQHGGSAQTIEVKIPKGIAHGAKLRVRGKGQIGPHNTGPGDLILQIHIAAHPYFRRQGNDLFIDVPISVIEAVSGTSIDVPTLTGTATVTIPPGTSGGRKLRLKGAGVEDARGQRGDLFTVITIDVPPDLSAADRRSFQELADRLPPARRNVAWNQP